MPTPLEQSLAAKFHAAKDTFASGWKIGTHLWLMDNEPGALAVTMLAEKDMEAVWEQAKSNAALVPFFDAALERWRTAHVEALGKWRARSGQ